MNTPRPKGSLCRGAHRDYYSNTPSTCAGEAMGLTRPIRTGLGSETYTQALPPAAKRADL